MHRSFLALAVAAVLLLALSVPASAQTWIQLRYWGVSNNASATNGVTDNFSTNLGGISIRRNFMSGMWAASFNFDQGAFTKPAGNFPAWTTANQYNRFWNLNIHRNFTTPSGAMFSLYGGWESSSMEWPNWPLPGGAYLRQNGPRIGADLKVPFAGNWVFSGDFGYGFGGNLTQRNDYVIGATTGSGNITDWRAGLGYNFNPTWGLEAGYRGIQWTINPNVAATCPAAPCNVKWNGWYFGLNFTAP